MVHLIRRFFGALTAKPLDVRELELLADWLRPPLLDLFLEQPVADQRHGFGAAMQVVGARGPEAVDLITAAALHDVGKRHAELGTIGRSFATVFIKLRLPKTGKMRAYRDHGKVGALELEASAAPTVAVEFARHHQYGRPVGFDEDTWELLYQADVNA